MLMYVIFTLTELTLVRKGTHRVSNKIYLRHDPVGIANLSQTVIRDATYNVPRPSRYGATLIAFSDQCLGKNVDAYRMGLP